MSSMRRLTRVQVDTDQSERTSDTRAWTLLTESVRGESARTLCLMQINACRHRRFRMQRAVPDFFGRTSEGDACSYANHLAKKTISLNRQGGESHAYRY